MKTSRLMVLFTIASILIFARTTNAALIQDNDLSMGAGNDGFNLTVDTGTGLKWLDLSLSNVRSYNDVASNLGAGGDFEGYRIATQDEILTLWTNAGIVYTGNFLNSSTNNQEILELINLVGPTGTSSGGAYGERTMALGWYDDTLTGSNPLAPSRASLQYFLPPLDPNDPDYFFGSTCSECSIASFIEENIFTLDDVNGVTGVWLVQAVPVPPALWLFGSGLLGLIGLSRRKKCK